MRRVAFALATGLAAFIGAWTPALAHFPEIFEVAHYFGATPEGSTPVGRLLQTPDGKIYGTAAGGGHYSRGVVFVLEPDGTGGFTYRALHSFFGPDGLAPFAGLVLGPDGYFYGTTITGGLFGFGTAFRMDASGRVTVIAHFPGSPGAADPAGELLVASDGYLYGAAAGGSTASGTIFRLSIAGELVSIHDFNGSDGSSPNGSLIESSDHYFYGTTFDGPNIQSTVFRVNAAGDFESLHTLTPDEGNWIRGGLVEVGGIFYGTSSNAGANFGGTLFKVDRLGNLTKLHDFDSGGDDGNSPFAGPTLASDGNLYGVTYAGGSNSTGALYRHDVANGTTSTIASFLSVTTGSHPQGALIQANDGLLYGTAADGLLGTLGAVVRSGLAGNLEPIRVFDPDEGIQPIGGLVPASDGNLYGTTALGGGNPGGGTLFRLGTDGTFATLADLVGHGSRPEASLIESPAGTLIGTARDGGANSEGTVFSSDLDGNLTTIASCEFPSGTQPRASAVLANGHMWATGWSGGNPSGHGTVFRIDAGVPTAVHIFGGGDGSAPTSLVLGPDDNLYGIATSGGPFTFSGTAFKVDPVTGDFTLLHEFGTAPDDPLVPSSLTATPDGTLLGTSLNGGASGDGALFELDTAGNVTVLHAFEGQVDGFGPNSVMATSEGHLIGTTETGGVGAVFELEPGDEEVALLHAFSGGTDGAGPMSALVEASDGSLYGTTAQGGTNSLGVVYRFVFPVDPTIVSLSPSSGPATGGTSIVVTGTHFRIDPVVTFGEVASPAAYDFDAQTAGALSPPLAPGSLNDVFLMNPDGSTATLVEGWFADFLDVPFNNPFHDSVEAIFRSKITVGCDLGLFCPVAEVTRAEMAVFLLKAKFGGNHVPPPPPPVPTFADVPANAFAAAWIEELAALGVTAGCGNGNYCPDASVTRAEMAVFLLKTLLDSGYVPPAPAGIFADVAPDNFAIAWIEDLFNRGVTAGCGTSPLTYCPDAAVPREQMATFIVRTFLTP